MYDAPVPGAHAIKPPLPGSRWESLIWPPWLPLRARLPLVAQIAGAAALMTAIAMPKWSDIPRAPETPVAASRPARIALPPSPARPAHLNLDVRHDFGSVELTVTVDGERVLQTKLAGSAKRFGMFGKRAERGFTKTLDLAPGVRIVRVRMRAAGDNFDQARVERFDLESASVAAMRIVADKNGLSVDAERPPAPVTVAAAAPPPPADRAPAATRAAQAAPSTAAVELYQSLRSILIAIAGFIASAATGFLVQEFLRSRRGLIFAEQAPSTGVPERRRRRRTNKLPRTPDLRAGAR